jgi:hypothetical protein
MKKHHMAKKEYIEVKKPKGALHHCSKCKVNCMDPEWEDIACPVSYGYYLKEVKTLPDAMEKQIWEIMDAYHASCRLIHLSEQKTSWLLTLIYELLHSMESTAEHY